MSNGGENWAIKQFRLTFKSLNKSKQKDERKNERPNKPASMLWFYLHKTIAIAAIVKVDGTNTAIDFWRDLHLSQAYGSIWQKAGMPRSRSGFRVSRENTSKQENTVSTTNHGTNSKESPMLISRVEDSELIRKPEVNPHAYLGVHAITISVHLWLHHTIRSLWNRISSIVRTTWCLQILVQSHQLIWLTTFLPPTVHLMTMPRI